MEQESYIRIRKTGGPIYMFEKSWARAGGILYGENFLTDICSGGEVYRDSTRIELRSGVWNVASIDTDPDFLLYLWKKGRWERFDFYIEQYEILFLYDFYRQNGFDMMLVDIEAANDRIQKNHHCAIV